MGDVSGMVAGELPHHMIREIREEPRAVEATLRECQGKIPELTGEIRLRRLGMIYLTGSGTSYHAGLACQYVLSSLTGLMTSLIPASEFPLWVPPTLPGKALLIAISQSGESSDVLAATRAALERKAEVLAVTNTPDSSLMRLARFTLLTHAEEERAVTATKSYTAQLAALFLLSLSLAEEARVRGDLEPLRESLFAAPRLMAEATRSLEATVRRAAEGHADKSSFFLLGSGPNYATALEGALKLKEACNVFAEGFATREFLHGPMQLADGRTPVFLISPPDEVDGSAGLLASLRRFGSPVILVTEEAGGGGGPPRGAVCIPSGLSKVFSPLLYILPLQLFAYYGSVARGLNPDRPEKLTKVVR